MAAPVRRHDNLVGTIWRSFRGLLLILVVVAIVYVLVSAAVAVNTANKCGKNGEFKAEKEWQYFPPEWECK